VFKEETPKEILNIDYQIWHGCKQKWFICVKETDPSCRKQCSEKDLQSIDQLNFNSILIEEKKITLNQDI